MQALLIDDSESVRRFLRQVLSDRGCEVLEAENGRDAWELLGSGWVPDVAFVDRQMPQMDGIDFVSMVRKDQRFDSMRIVMCCSPLTTVDQRKLPPTAIQKYLPKPFVRESIARVFHDLTLTS